MEEGPCMEGPEPSVSLVLEATVDYSAHLGLDRDATATPTQVFGRDLCAACTRKHRWREDGPGVELVGQRVRVWWPEGSGVETAGFFAGVVVSYAGGRHTLRYDDGEEHDEDLTAERWERVLDKEAEGESEAGGGFAADLSHDSYASLEATLEAQMSQSVEGSPACEYSESELEDSESEDMDPREDPSLLEEIEALPGAQLAAVVCETSLAADDAIWSCAVAESARSDGGQQQQQQQHGEDGVDAADGGAERTLRAVGSPEQILRAAAMLASPIAGGAAPSPPTLEPTVATALGEARLGEPWGELISLLDSSACEIRWTEAAAEQQYNQLRRRLLLRST